MSAGEQSRLAALAADERRRALLRLWTCKEAMSKATGDALVGARFASSISCWARSRACVDGPAPYSPGRWRLLPVEVPGGYLATVGAVA